MKVAFFFDAIIYKDEKNDYYGMTFYYDFFKKRYLDIFDNMVVSMRVKNKNEATTNISGYRILNGENLEVKPIENYKEIPDAIKRKSKIKKEVDDIVKNVDKVIIRMPSVIGMFACDSAKKYNKPYMIEMVACPFDGYSNHTNAIGKIMAPIMFLLNRKYIKKAPNVLYVTSEFLQKRYPNNNNTIACSDVVLKEFSSNILDERKEKILKKLDTKNIIVSTVASVGLKYKGQEFVMEAISKLKGKVNIKYKIAGAGDDTRLRNIAKKLEIEDNVEFLGSLTHDKVFDLLDNTDIYIQPSLQEGLPRALIEAMSRACPAIASRTGGIPELLDQKYIFEKKNVKQLVKLLENLNKEELIIQAEKNFNKALEFESEKLNKKRAEFYKSL